MLESVATRDFVSDQLLSWTPEKQGCSFNDFPGTGSSALVVEALKLVVRDAGRPALYTPLYVRGEEKTGKTYLLNALAAALREKGVPFMHIDGRVLRIGSRLASYDLGFRVRDRLSEVKVVLVDNLEELDQAPCHGQVYAALADLAAAKGHVVVTSDRPPSRLNRMLGSFARSLQGGIELVLERATQDRSIERAVKDRYVSPGDVLRTVSDHYRVSVATLKGKRRAASIVHARHIAMYVVRTLNNDHRLSLPEIGRMFGNRDHTTVLHAVEKIEGLMERDQAVFDEVILIRRMLGVAA